MPSARFRLDRVTIEGFKAFTKEQKIELGGGHLFIFGDNGSGKSSIIEAIRWALFGLENRPEAEVRNAFYEAGDCRVELLLSGSDGQWLLIRRLRPGAGRSELTITNAQGKSVLLKEAFPHIARLAPHEGTHIIYAAQDASARRPHADISDFDKILYSYLQLEDVPELLQKVEGVLGEQNEAEKQLASQVNEAEEGLRRGLEDVRGKSEELLRNPPWGEAEVPTTEETHDRVRLFAEEISRLANAPAPSEADPSRLLATAEKWILQLSQASRTELQKKSLILQGKRTSLLSIRDKQDQAETERTRAEKEIADLENRLAVVMQGKTKGDLDLQLAGLKQSAAVEGQRLLLVKEAQKLVSSEAPSECPICSTTFPPCELTERLGKTIEKAAASHSEAAGEIAALQQKHNEVGALELRRQLQVKRLQDSQGALVRLQAELSGLLSKAAGETVSATEISSYLDALDSAIGIVAAESHTADQQSASRKKKIEDLRTELRFHEYRKREQFLGERLLQGLDPVRDRHREVVELIDTLREIRDKLQQTFNEELDRTFPHLNRMMSNVYRRLTKQVSFENVYIEREESSSLTRKLRVSVGSSRAPQDRHRPENVLNGQALSALRLVPYFVFSHFQKGALEFDFLLIDDPSQSFDTARVQLLLNELAKASAHAQLVVATHEEDRFAPELPKRFGSGELKVVHAAGFTPETGPNLVFTS